MDMKRILQALDNASTKPVEGASDMSKFLRIVDEAAINQVPPMPDVTGIQPGTSKELEDGEKVTVNQDGTVSYAGAWGTYVYNAQGQHIKTQSPSFAGFSQETNPQGQVTQQNYNQGPLSIQQGQQGSSTSYDMGTATASQSKDANGNVTQQALTPNAQQLEEGANPHGVSLAVQMAMNHYQKPKSVTPKRTSLLKQYFAEAEEAVAQKEEERKDMIKQYASVIAERVLVKESKELNETPIDMTGDPNDPTIYGHEKANPMSLKGRIMQARAQLKELAQLAESNDLAVWQDICAKSKGGMFMGLEQNIEQIRHGIAELAAKRKKGGVQSRGIDKNISERSVSQAQAHLMAAAAHNPEFAKKVKMKQSVAKEFNKADKGKNIKSLPVRVPKKK